MGKTQTHANERIVSHGDPGTAMYVLVEGFGRFDYGSMWTPPELQKEITTTPTSASGRFQQLTAGQSFGEEIVFGLAETYMYTIVAVRASTFYSISEDGFKDQFRNMPDLHDL